jgi:hypothetical protein
MAEQVSPGRLVAIDGSRGNDVRKAAEALAARLRDRGVACAISHWDASGLFGELAQGEGEHDISPRTLTLLYAADLAFRVRWEIAPVLREGGVVIAAPYVETAVGFGVACGLADRWLRNVLRFVPAADARGLTEERKRRDGWARKPDRGYAEYCAGVLDAATSQAFSSKRTRRAMMDALERSRARGVLELSEDRLAAAVKRLTGSPRASSGRSPSPPRTARR